jgi:26S proteasome regulatory subunit N10
MDLDLDEDALLQQALAMSLAQDARPAAPAASSAPAAAPAGASALQTPDRPATGAAPPAAPAKAGEDYADLLRDEDFIARFGRHRA